MGTPCAQSERGAIVMSGRGGLLRALWQRVTRLQAADDSISAV
jgi:hypothetical protein